MAQCNHGPEKTTRNSLVIQILAKGNAYDRTLTLSETIRPAGVTVLTGEEPQASEPFSILHIILPLPTTSPSAWV